MSDKDRADDVLQMAEVSIAAKDFQKMIEYKKHQGAGRR